MKFKPKDYPTKTGVYIFKDKNNKILYIGKAINLRNRLKSYFKGQDRRPKVKILVPLIEKIKTIEINSEFEALILESSLIKKYQPKFNSVAKDDKHPLYIAITQEEFPKVKLSRKIISTSLKTKNNRTGVDLYGPFPSAYTVRQVLKFIRKIFPYCSCKNNQGRPCLYASIGLCKPCPRTITKLKSKSSINESQKNQFKKQKSQYRKQIKLMKQLLSGHTAKVVKSLNKEMQTAANEHNYELASYYRDGLKDLNKLLQQNSRKFEKPNLHPEFRQIALDRLKRILNSHGFNNNIKNLIRIEAYDISTSNGKHSTGSMVVFQKGLPEKSEYRHFKIKNTDIIQKRQPNDVAMMTEVLNRRFSHDSQKSKPSTQKWPLPDLIVIDGGNPQLNKAKKIIKQTKQNIPVIGLAKKLEQIYIPSNPKNTKISLPSNSPSLHILQHLRDEAHRFANRYRKKLISKEINAKKSN